MAEASSTNKRPMTDEERNELCKKLEAETEEYFRNCKPKKYSEGWDPKSFEKEMEQHPLFATKLADNGELPPLLEALQQIKYDESENTPESLAKSYKDDGNYSFKKMDYRSAIASYTEGIRQNCINREVNAQLFLNRAAAQFHLNNFNASLADCMQAIDYKEDYAKAIYRAALCCFELRKLDECEEFCQSFLKLSPDDNSIEQLKQKIVAERKLQERNKRKLERAAKEKHEREVQLKEIFTQRGAKFIPEAAEGEIIPNLIPKYASLVDYPVTYEEGCLIWPVALIYPELKETDFIQRWSEETTIKQMLDVVFDCEESIVRHVVGDENQVYRYESNQLQVWYKSRSTDRPIGVKGNTKLRDIIQKKDFIIEDGVPSFWVTRKDSAFEKQFLQQQGK